MAVNSSALLARRRQLLDQVRTTTGDHLGRVWDSLDHYTDDEEWNRLAGPVVAAGQGRALSIQLASLQAMLGVSLGYKRADLLDKATIDISQPFIALANAMSNGETFDAAVLSGRDRAQGVGESAVVYACRAGNTAADQHVSGWERIPEGDACDWCVLVSGQTYHTAESASFGHLRCACDVVPVGESPAEATAAEAPPTEEVTPVASPLEATASAGPQYPGDLSPSGAAQWLRDTWGADGERFFDFSGLGADTANGAASTMNDLLTEFPNSAKRIKSFGSSGPVTKEANARGLKTEDGRNLRLPRMNGQLADTSKEAGQIRLSPKTKDLQSVVESMARDVKTGFHPRNFGDIDSIVEHEFGHNVLWTAEQNAGPLTQQLLDIEAKYVGFEPGTAEFQRGRYELIKGEVSRYAIQNDDELVAEAFAMVRAGNPSAFAQEIYDLVVPLAEGPR